MMNEYDQITGTDCGVISFIADNIVGGYEPNPAQWRDIRFEEPQGDVIAVRTPYGYFLHSMKDKSGRRLKWGEMGERWQDQFDYSDVIEWVRLK